MTLQVIPSFARSSLTRYLRNPTCVEGLYGGYLTFVVSIAAIGLCTAVIGDVAGHLGCFIYLKDSVNAIAFVALGTSVPGTPMEFMSAYFCFNVAFSLRVKSQCLTDAPVEQA